MAIEHIRRMSDTDIETIHSISWAALGTGMTTPHVPQALAEYARSVAASNLIIIELMIRDQEMVSRNRKKSGEKK